MSKARDRKGKVRISDYLQEFKLHDKVYLNMEPAIQKGQYNLRFYGSYGEVTGIKGKCYEVTIKHLNAVKKVIVHPVHLKKA